MLIVGAGAALTAIAAFYAWLFIHKQLSWRERKAKERLARRRAIEEHEHEHAHHAH